MTRAGAANPLAWVAYPLTLVLIFSWYFLVRQLGAGPQWSAYLAAAAAAAIVTGLERVNPHLDAWRGGWNDIRSDALYMVIVQALLPALLGITLSLWLLRAFQASGWDVAALWPHGWPVAAQVVLMLAAADLLRYWLHVAAHRYAPLWRLHAVHHSPDRLYWLNVGRFHPVEKGLQYLLDALPFIVMGVGEEVLALYFVFYATNGYFQHSNIELRFGLLNYVISSAELHRWHHSRLPEESNHNYGNNLIIWDLLFGTRYLPGHREIRQLGLPNCDYPMSFTAQMKTPLIRGIEQRSLPEIGWREIWLNTLIWTRMTYLHFVNVRCLARAAEKPVEAQSSVLKRILADNRDSIFGRQHSFATIRSIDDFRACVSVQDYEDLRPYIERQEHAGSAELTVEPPVLYAKTSGTTAMPKFVPVLASTIAQLRDAQSTFAAIQFRAVPDAYYGRYLVIVSPAVEGRMASGRPFGSASGHIYRGLPRPVRAKYLLPWQLFEIEDYDLKYLLIVRLALAEKNISLMASANPSTFLKLRATLLENRLALLADVRAQVFAREHELPTAVRDALQGRFACPPGRIRELEALLSADAPDFAEIWPNLRLLTTWTSGSCRTALSALRPHLPADIVIADPGYVASEFRGTITVDIGRGLGVPMLTESFFEFVEVSDWGRECPRFLTVDELEPGSRYYVIATTAAGLYRYFINDIVRVTGRYRNTPTIEFVQKGKGVTNVTGEKLYEGQVIEAFNSVIEALGVSVEFFVVLADVDDAVYRSYVELSASSSVDRARMRDAIEHALCTRNVEYREKLASGRLRPLELTLLQAGTREAFKRARLEAGIREGQFKEPALAYAADLDFHFSAFADGRQHQ